MPFNHSRGRLCSPGRETGRALPTKLPVACRARCGFLLWPWPRHTFPLYLARALLGAVSAPAQEEASALVWEQTTVRLEFEDNNSQQTSFHFRNTGQSPVTIRSVSTSCGCTVSKTDKMEYAPGESGTLPVTHKPKPGPGLRNYRINVLTDEGGGREHALTLQVMNNPRVTIQPRVLNWAKDEARSAKNVDIRLKKDDVLKVTGASAIPDVLDFSINDAPDERHQILVATPKRGTGVVPGRVRIQLTTDPATPPSMDTQFFALLR